MKARNLMLKTVGPNGESHGGFLWPLEVGAIVNATTWKKDKECGNGLHGFLHGRGNGELASWDPTAKWIVAECLESISILHGKVKCKSAIIRYVGDRKGATDFIILHTGATGVIGATLTGGDYATLTGGNHATLTGGDYATLTGGDYATLTGGCGAKLTGGNRAKLTGGNRAKLTGGNRAKLTGGDYAMLTGGNHATLTGGDYATLTGGDYATLNGGDYATLVGGDCSTLIGGAHAILIGGKGSVFRGRYGCTIFHKAESVSAKVDGSLIKPGACYKFTTRWTEV